MNKLRTIQIFCNYYENYNDYNEVPYYKIKGQHVFEMDVDFDDLLYRKDQLKAAINDMIAKETNPDNYPDANKYIIVDIELKDGVTQLPSLSSEDLTGYKPTRENRINLRWCSQHAYDSLMRLKNVDEVLES
jgi:hypothetical protein